MQADRPAVSWFPILGREDRIIRRRNVHACGNRSERRVQIAARRARVVAARQTTREKRRGERDRRDQSEPLMDLQHVRPLVEPRLILRAALRLRVRKSKIS